MDQDKIRQIIENTLKLLDINEDKFEIGFEDGAAQIQINLPEEETGIYIGSHADSLSSLQLLLSLMVSQRLNQWVRINLNINDYKQRRQETLHQLADNAAAKAIELNQEIIIPNISPYERRIIHLYLEENSTAKSESRGEGQNRQLFIIPPQE